MIQQHFHSHKPASFYAKELDADKLIDEAKRELVFTLGSVQEIS